MVPPLRLAGSQHQLQSPQQEELGAWGRLPGSGTQEVVRVPVTSHRNVPSTCASPNWMSFHI